MLVVDGSNTVRYREVTLGSLHDGLRVVTAGLNPGERIVVSGMQRARPNDVVNAHAVNMAGTPGSDAQPSAKPAA